VQQRRLAARSGVQYQRPCPDHSTRRSGRGNRRSNTTSNAATWSNNLANLSDLGRREEALAAAEEAIHLYRALVEARPDAFTPDLALALNNLSGWLNMLGRRVEALAASGLVLCLGAGLVGLALRTAGGYAIAMTAK